MDLPISSSLSPHGESGLKSDTEKVANKIDESLPAWGEWIEIYCMRSVWSNFHSLSPHGESGLKSGRAGQYKHTKRVSPRMGRVD